MTTFHLPSSFPAQNLCSALRSSNQHREEGISHTRGRTLVTRTTSTVVTAGKRRSRGSRRCARLVAGVASRSGLGTRGEHVFPGWCLMLTLLRGSTARMYAFFPVRLASFPLCPSLSPSLGRCCVCACVSAWWLCRCLHFCKNVTFLAFSDQIF